MTNADLTTLRTCLPTYGAHMNATAKYRAASTSAAASKTTLNGWINC